MLDEFNTTYLHTPNTSKVKPPIQGTVDTLPVEELAWEDFEKLCLRIVQIHHSIDDCEIYGIKGQKQDGIDIFAYNGDKYASYQCKKYQKVKEGDLEKAVKVFEDGDWFKNSDEFTFCTSTTLDRTELQNKFNELKTKLANQGITFKTLDKSKISRLLKDYPSIVFDFFGEGWVKAFHGEDALNQIRKTKKLDAHQITIYRVELYRIYDTIFQKYDPSSPSGYLDDCAIRLQERFIKPEFIQKQQASEYRRLDKRADDFEYSDIPSKESELDKTKESKSFEIINYETEVRLSIDAHLPTSDNIMILGEPGSGKSTLLRYIVLDLLSTHPKLENITRKWGDLLPIWLPFAFITKNLHRDENLNLSDLLCLWFRSNNSESIFDIVKDALDDERLLLVVDGVDEWTNITVAKQAIAKIETQTSLKNAKVIYSSRPYGYRLQQEYFQQLQIHTIANLSDTQKKEHISYWYTKLMAHLNKTINGYVELETNQFLVELKKSKDLYRLSDNPLLLSILISQRFQNAVLPKNKVEILESITEYLIKKHPTKRRVSANISEEVDLDFDIEEVFIILAMHIQEEHHDGVISKNDATKVISKYFEEEMHYHSPQAKKLSKDILDIGANKIGIIIEKSPTEIAFMHRQFQEFMSAKYLMNFDSDVSQGKIEAYASLLQWNQVITFYFGLIPSPKKKYFKQHFDCIKISEGNELHYVDFLKASIALTLSNAPVDLSKNYLSDFIKIFEYETNPTKKEIMWEILLKALFNNKIRSQLLDFFFRYFPNKYNYSDTRLQALEHANFDQLTPAIKEFLFKSIIDGNHYQKLEASKRIQQFINDKWLFDKVAQLMESCYNPEILAYLVNSIISDKVDNRIRKKYLNKYGATEHPDIFVFVMKLKIHLGCHTIKDLDTFVNKQRSASYTLDDEIERILINGWSKSKELYIHLIDSLNLRISDAKIRKETAWRILFEHYNDLDEVVDRITEEFENKEYPFSFIHSAILWKLLAENFSNNPKVISVVNKKIKSAKGIHPQMEKSYAGLIGCTDENKREFLDTLESSSSAYWSITALLAGWSGDKEVQKSLENYFKSTNAYASISAYYIKDVFRNKPSEGIILAEKILFDKECKFRERALSPLITLDKNYFDKNILDNFIEYELESLSKETGRYYEALHTLVSHFHQNDKIKQLAIRNLSKFPEVVFKYYSYLIPNFEDLISTSLPLAENLRLKLISELAQNRIGDDEIVSRLSQFHDEENEVIKSASALTYFDFIKEKFPETVLDVSQNLVFQTGPTFQVDRRIAFFGFLTLESLDDYYQLLDESQYMADRTDEERRASPELSFDDGYKHSRVMTDKLIANFDYIYKVIDKDFSKISRYSIDNIQPLWGFIAKYSSKDAQSAPYILSFIEDNIDDIDNINLIDFLSRISTNSNSLKKILIKNIDSDNEGLAVYSGRMLGERFSQDKDVYDLVSQIKGIDKHSGRLMALCYGWPENEELKSEFDRIAEKSISTNRDLAYSMKFLFRDLKNIMDFFDIVFLNYNEAYYEYHFFSQPLMRRFKNDTVLQAEVKFQLLDTNSTHKKISFYSLLESAGRIDKDILDWKKKELLSDDKHHYGYNIVDNNLFSLGEVLDNVSFEIL